jgi:GNAT superfamily N-acetyltransferase
MAVGLLEPEAADDAALVDRLSDLINNVCEIAERGLWRDGFARTTAPELAELIRAREIAVATRDGRIVGSVRVHDVSGDTSEFGMLVASPDQRSTGVGRALLDFVERRNRERGLRAMQLELLVPRDGAHPDKDRLRAWYERLGYRVVRTAAFEEIATHAASELARPCEFVVFQKPL